MADYTVSLTDTQVKCLEYVANSIQDWADNELTARALSAQKEIIAILVNHCNDNYIDIASGVDAQITQAYDLGIVETAAARQTAAASELS